MVMLFDYNLRTATEEEMFDVLSKVFGVDEEGDLITSSTMGEVVLLPNLSKPTGHMIDDDTPEYAKLEGFHANARLRKPSNLLNETAIKVETPLVKFA